MEPTEAGTYDHRAIESRWQRYWQEHQTFKAVDGADKPKFYVLDMFPYPSGQGLHVGHPAGYTASDILARHKRMKGYNVLHPMGYDAFGLPAEQYAVEHGVHPRATTEKNIANIEKQIKMFGFSYDWSRRLATTDVGYYRWTQWIFLKMFNSWYDPAADAARPIEQLIEKLQNEDYLISPIGELIYNDTENLAAILGDPVGAVKFYELAPAEQRELIDSQRLAYMAQVPVNWCPRLGTVLANEEVTNEGRSERGNHPVYRRALTQWMLRITKYAERLLADVDALEWPEPIKLMQRNWIGKSTGAQVYFPLDGRDDVLEVYTTRPDTLFGATYMVLAPEHPLVEELTGTNCRPQVADYMTQAAKKSELERTAESKEKTGVFIGAYAVNPVNDQKIPIWVADYVLMGYGTGAIMAVPAHDTRDMEFALKFDLPIVQVVEPPAGTNWRGYVGDGIAVNSGKFDGLTTAEFKEEIIKWLTEQQLGRRAVNYKLRDWLFSRQRYWGEPLPIVHCAHCGTVALPDEQLPLELPEMEDFTPAASDDPDSLPQPPLGKLRDWAQTTCPQCQGPAQRELNTMPQWAGSCWYYLRFLDPHNDRACVDPQIERYWMAPDSDNPVGGVDFYIGGAEHAVLHLLYARFWHKLLYDLGYASSPEPFRRLFNQGMIRSFAYRDPRGMTVGYDQVDKSGQPPRHKQTGEPLVETVEKMSKSLKNVVNPNEVIEQYGADTFRMYEMFMGPLEASKPWNTNDVPGIQRFLQRLWRLIVAEDGCLHPAIGDAEPDAASLRLLHKTIKKVTADIETLSLNTAISQMMIFLNEYSKAAARSRWVLESYVLLLSPFAPHIAEELWRRLGHETTLAYEPWPVFDEELTRDPEVELAVQINGKVRDRIVVPADSDEESIRRTVLALAKIQEQLAQKTVRQVIVIPNRLVNIVAN
ncbi:MAG: leucine--tRNA ligase [Sedimentisphaerales bacterium]|nr:leucine--tRNA ligase [Sedimentisphaerales bacterium]